MSGNSHERCWVPGCVNYDPKTKVQTCGFFSFPVNNVNRCQQWLKAVGWEELVHLPPRFLRRRYVCSEHFTDVSQNKKKKTISQTAIPTVFSATRKPLSDDLVQMWPPTMENSQPSNPSSNNGEPQHPSAVSPVLGKPSPASLQSFLGPILSEHGQFPSTVSSSPQPQDDLTVPMPCASGDVDGELWGIIIKKGSTLHAVPLHQAKSVQVQIIQDKT